MINLCRSADHALCSAFNRPSHTKAASAFSAHSFDLYISRLRTLVLPIHPTSRRLLLVDSRVLAIYFLSLPGPSLTFTCSVLLNGRLSYEKILSVNIYSRLPGSSTPLLDPLDQIQAVCTMLFSFPPSRPVTHLRHLLQKPRHISQGGSYWLLLLGVCC